MTLYFFFKYRRYDVYFSEKQHRVEGSKEIFCIPDNDLKCIITSEETWIYNYDTETVQLSSEWREPTGEPNKKLPTTRKKTRCYY